MINSLKFSRLRNVAAIAACLAVTTMFSGCDKTNDPDKPSAISVSDERSLTQEVFANREQGSSVDFTTKAGWTSSISTGAAKAADGDNWVSIVPDRGSVAGKYTVEISLTPNLTGADRTATITISCKEEKIDIRVTQKGASDGSPIPLKSPITQNTTLKDLGLPVDYVYSGNTNLPLRVENNATLTIEPGVTIQFTHSMDGARGIVIAEGSTIKANGTSSKRIQFIGANNEKGSWRGINVESMTDNQFSYCDFLNAGLNMVSSAALYLFHAKASITHCKFTNGKGYGLYMHNFGKDVQLTAFNNNVFEDFDEAPLYIYFAKLDKQLDKFDMTSDFTKNKKAYIQLNTPTMDGDATINQTTVPYYIDWWLEINHTLTINEGVTLYMAEGGILAGDPHTYSRLMINGTAAKKVKITRLPGETYHWCCIHCDWIPGSVIKHCILEYGGTYVYGVIFLPVHSNLTLDNVEFRHTGTYDAVIPAGSRYIDIYVKHSNITYSRPSGNVYLEGGNIPPNFDNLETTFDALPDYWK